MPWLSDVAHRHLAKASEAANPIIMQIVGLPESA
jgi:hypothetical protein